MEVREGVVVGQRGGHVVQPWRKLGRLKIYKSTGYLWDKLVAIVSTPMNAAQKETPARFYARIVQDFSLYESQ